MDLVHVIESERYGTSRRSVNCCTATEKPDREFSVDQARRRRIARVGRGEGTTAGALPVSR